VLAETIHLYAATDLGPQIVATYQSLPLDIHRVKVICDGTHDTSASGTAVSWYALEVMR
jgi:hypothetical protein